MNDNLIALITTALQFRFEEIGRKWTDVVHSGFERILEPLSEEFGCWLSGSIHGIEPLPNSAAIVRLAAEYESPTPDDKFAWAEVQREVSKPHPKYTHKLIARTVVDLGGDMVIFTRLREGDRNGAMLAQFREAYNTKRAHWQRLVIAELQKPRPLWNLELFPVPAGYDYVQGELAAPPCRPALPASPSQRRLEAGVAPPTEVIKKLRGIGLGRMVDGWNFPGSGVRMHDAPLDQERMEQVRQDVIARERRRLEAGNDDD